MNPHKWAKEIKAWADGAEIENREQPTQAPVAWMHRHAGEITEFNDFQSCQYCEPLYTHPHQWQELNTEDVMRLWREFPFDRGVTVGNKTFLDIARAIEAKLKEKNT